MGTEYPQDLTPEEAELGYQLQEVDYPQGHAPGAPRRARAVAYQAADPAERVLKVRDPASGRVEYQRQVHGVHNPPAEGEVPGWRVCGRHPDPATALSEAARQADLARLHPPVVPSPPPIARQHGA